MSNYPVGKMVLSSLGFGLVFYVVWWVFFDHFFAHMLTDYASFMRPAGDTMVMYGMPFAAFVMGFVYTYLYHHFHHAVHHSGMMKGVMFGFYVWLLFAAYGFFDYTMSVHAFSLTVVWLFAMAVVFMVGGVVVHMFMGVKD